jgi:hypothetical protein
VAVAALVGLGIIAVLRRQPGTTDVELTLITSDRYELACSSASTVGRYACGCDCDKMTVKAEEAGAYSAQARKFTTRRRLAEQRNHQELTPEHVLSALLTQEQGIAGALLRKMGVETETVWRAGLPARWMSSRRSRAPPPRFTSGDG